MEFNKTEYISKQQQSVSKLILLLNKKGITFSPSDNDNLENVVFTHGDKTIKMSHHSFYRFSGIACVYKEKENSNETEVIKVTDEMYLNEFIKKIVELRLGLK